MLSAEARAARRAYKREWARANPDKVKAQQERYWARQAAKNAAAPSADEAITEQTEGKE